MAGSGLKKHAVISLAVVVLMLFAPLLMLVPGAASAPGVTDTISVGNTPYGHRIEYGYQHDICSQ